MNRTLHASAFLSLAAVTILAAADPSPWWLTPQRLLQTNLRDIDATMDLERYVRDVKEFGAGVVLFNVGGIVANYPTALACHWRNPHMHGDLVGTVLERLHAEGLRMIGRFDFSKINEAFAAEHPEWLYVGEGTYHDTDTARWTLLTCGERQLACAAVHFVRIPYRHAAVSPSLTARRLWQQMMGGAWLDFYCIGPLDRQEDRTGLDAAAAIYRFHAANEAWLTDTEGAGQVALVRRGDREYAGLLKILHEPLPISDIAIALEPRAPVRTVRRLTAGTSLPVTERPDGRLSVTVPRLDRYEVVLFEYE